MKKMRRILASAMALCMLASAPVSALAADKQVNPRSSVWDITREAADEEQQEEQAGKRVADKGSLTELTQDGVRASEDFSKEQVSGAVEGEASQGQKITFEESDEKVTADFRKEGVKRLDNGEEGQEKVRVIIVMKDKSILERDSKASMNWLNRLRVSQMESKQASVMNKIEDKVLDGQELDVKYQYTWALNGVATEVPADKIPEIEEIPGVAQVVRTSVYSLCSQDAAVPYTVGDGEMIGRQDTWNKGYTGKGMRIAIIDTGLDDDHPSFAAMPEENLTDTSATLATVGKVIGDLNASELYSGLKADQVYRSTKVPYAFNYVDRSLRYNHGDSASDHGTHVAGIAAANELTESPNGQLPSVGVAPDAQIYVMKVFGQNGGAYTDDLLAAVEDSLILGADVINMSLGSTAGFTSEGELLDAVYGRVSESNTVLAIAAGNESTEGQGNLWGTESNLASNPDNATIGSPSTFVNATSVASVDNISVMSDYVEAAGKRIAYEDGANGQNRPFQSMAGEQHPYAVVENMGQSPEDFAAANVAGKIAVVQRGVTAFTEKCQFAEEAGAVGCLIYNNVSGTISMDMSGAETTIPCASITMNAGEYLKAALEQDPALELTISSEPAAIESETGYRMSSFSSWGISPDLRLEPDVTAPGGNIYSTLDNGQYGLMSGTSMASPNMAGVSALVSEYVRENFPQMPASEQHVFINALVMSTAMPLMYDEKLPFSPRSQGSGLVNAYNAISTSAYLDVEGIDTPKIELFDDPEKTGEYHYTFQVKNFGSKDNYYLLDTNAQTEGKFYDEFWGREFMSSTPVELLAVTAESSGQMVLTYDYNGDGACTAEDLEILRAKTAEKPDAEDAFRYDLNGDDVCDGQDVQAYEAALAGTSQDVDLEAQVLKVEAGETADVEVTVALTEEDRSYLDTFENGIYVEGYTTLTAQNAGGIDLSLPYMGFYGDWTQAPIIDTGYYWEDEDTLEANQYYNILFSNFGTSENGWTPGLNAYVDEPFEPKNVAVSPNGDGYDDTIDEIYVSLLRNAKRLNVTYTDAVTGEVYYEDTIENMGKSCYVAQYDLCVPAIISQLVGRMYDMTDKDGNPLANNTKLLLSIKGELDYEGDGNRSDSWNMGITVDTEAPVLKDASFATVEEDGQARKLLTLTFSDNLDTAAINVLNEKGTAIIGQYAVDDVAPGEDCTMTVDVTGVGNKFNVVLGDYALNESTWMLRTEDNDPVVDTSLLYGYRVADTQIQNDALYGWISVDSENAQTEVMSSEYYMDYALTAAEYVGGYIIAVDADDTLVAIRPGYWDERITIARLGIKIRDLAFDRTTQTLYGFDSTNSSLVTIDVYTGQVTTVSQFFMMPLCVALACDDDGVLYGIKNDMNGSLCVIDKETGAWGDTVLETAETTGFYNPYYSQSMTWDSEKQCLYWAGYYSSFDGSSGELYQIDVNAKTVKSCGVIAGDAEVVGLLKLDGKGYEIPEAELAGIAMDHEAVTLLPGMAQGLEVLKNPWNSAKVKLVWSSGDETVAQVSEYGEVAAVGAGETTVTASVEGRPELTAVCQVKVVEPKAELNAFALLGESLQNQWISFNAGSVSQAEAKSEAGLTGFMAGEYVDGYIYAYNEMTEMYKIDAATFAAEKISEAEADYFMQDMAFDYSTGYLYGLAQNVQDGMSYLMRIDRMTGAMQLVCQVVDDFGNPANTLAISTEGVLYVTTQSGMLCTVNPEEGTVQRVGMMGYTPAPYNQTMAYDHNTGELYLYLITSDGQVSLMYVDQGTGSVLPLGAADGGAQLTTMYAVPEQAPALPQVDVEEVSLKEASVTMLEGTRKTVPVEVLPYNATDRELTWTVEDPAVVSVAGSVITGLQPGATKVTGVLGEFSVTFDVKVLQAAGDLYGYVLSDLSDGSGLFWGKFQDNDLSQGEGLAMGDTYEAFAGEYYDGKIYAVGPDEESYEWQFMVIDADTYQVERVVQGAYPDMRDMAFDYTEGVMYGVGGVRNVSGNTTLYMLDIKTGGCYAIGQLEDAVVTLACSPEGQLCGVSETGTYYEIDKRTGELTYGFETNYLANSYQSMAYDWNTGNLYWAQAGQDPMTMVASANLLMIDPQQQTVTNLGYIGSIGCVLTALYTIPAEKPEIAAPAVTKILLGTESKMLKLGESFTLGAAPYPLSVANEAVQVAFQSENPEVASVDEQGLVTALGAGRTTITASCGDVSASCTVNVVDASRKLSILEPDGWTASPLLEPETVEEGIRLPAEAGLSMKTAALHSDGYLYAVDDKENATEWGEVSDAENGLWRVSKDGTEAEQISQKPLPQWLDAELAGANPVICDLESNGKDLYALVSVVMVDEEDIYGTMHYYICKLDLETETMETACEIGMDVGRPVRFSFLNESECAIYDLYRDCIFKQNVETGETAQIAWTQNVFVAGKTIGMAYSKEFDMIFVATEDTQYRYTMSLYCIDPHTGKTELIGDAAYSPDLKDILLMVDNGI